MFVAVTRPLIEEQLFPQIPQLMRVLKESRHEFAEVRRPERRVHDSALAAVVVPFGKEDPLAQDHGQVTADFLRFRIVVRARDEHMVKCRRVAQHESVLSARGTCERIMSAGRVYG